MIVQVSCWWAANQQIPMWIGVLGLSLDLIGVVIIALPATRFVSWPILGRIGKSNKLKEAKSSMFRVDIISEGSDSFEALLPLLRKKHGDFGLEQPPNKITSMSRIGSGAAIAVAYWDNGEKEQDVIGPIAMVDDWIESHIEQAYLRWGLSLVALGFALQIVSRVMQPGT